MTSKSAEMSPKSSLQIKLNHRQSIIECKKRIRSKTALQGPRGRYNNYADAKIDWLSIFEQVQHSHDKKNKLKQLFPKINYNTFIRRYSKWINGGSKLDGCGDDRGGHNAA